MNFSELSFNENYDICYPYNHHKFFTLCLHSHSRDNRKYVSHAFTHISPPVGVGVSFGINRKQFIFESLRHSNTNYGFVSERVALKALKTLKCTCFCLAKKQKDEFSAFV